MLQPSTPVWRYMSFAKFVSILQKKQLWLTSVEYLNDKWEVMPDSKQLRNIDVDQAAKIVRRLREQSFVNCWNASEYESYALWMIYCGSPEGVAIQTTFDRLKKSVKFPVVEVNYGPYEANTEQDLLKLVSQKRPMFAYEQEVRIVLVHDLSDPNTPERKTIGAHTDWDPELHIEKIYVHPDAQHWFMETVMETVGSLAPRLSSQVFWSNMKTLPPF